MVSWTLLSSGTLRVLPSATSSVGSDHSSSAPNSEFEFEDDGEPADIELSAMEDEDSLDPIPVILRLIPATVRDGSPVLEVWGARPFGYAGSSIVWTVYRAEPASDDVDDGPAFWAPLGISVDPYIFYRAFVVRQTRQTMNNPPPAPPPTPISYIPQERMVQPVPGALLIKTFNYHPEENTILDGHYISTFWLVGCGRVSVISRPLDLAVNFANTAVSFGRWASQVRDKKDWKRILQKIDLYLNVVRSPDPAMRYNALPYDHPYYRPLPPDHPEYNHPGLR